MMLILAQGWIWVFPSVLKLQGALVGWAPTTSPCSVADAHCIQWTGQQAAHGNKMQRLINAS